MEVRRTRAGDAELATPSRGLSLAQRRILTLLDTPATLAGLGQRHALDPGRVERDAARLRLAGLIEDVAPATVAVDAATPVRLGAPLVRRLPLALLPIVAGGLAWAAWQHLAPSAGTDSPRTRRAAPVATTQGKVNASAATEPVPIATRVLRGNAPERAADAGKPSKAALALQPITGGAIPPARAVQPTPIDTLLPAPRVDAKPAAEITPADVKPATDPRPAAQPEARAEPGRAASPADVDAAAPADRAPGPSTRLSPMPPLQVANIAPIAASPHAPASVAKVTPIVRDTPAFPREAIAQGLASGNVKARITVDARGRVASVDILETSHRAFERTVRETLAGWQFEPGPSGRTTTVDVAFKRD